MEPIYQQAFMLWAILLLLGIVICGVVFSIKLWAARPMTVHNRICNKLFTPNKIFGIWHPTFKYGVLSQIFLVAIIVGTIISDVWLLWLVLQQPGDITFITLWLSLMWVIVLLIDIIYSQICGWDSIIQLYLNSLITLVWALGYCINKV